MVKIKICGIRRIEDINYCNIAKPDYIGFIFVKGRKRYIDPIRALELKKKLNSDIKVVGVFLDEDIDIVIQIANMNICDIIQLHGNESDEYIKELKNKTNLEIIKVYRESEFADYIMVDNKDAGSGLSWNYNIKNITKPAFIAGGIGVNNVIDVLKLNPYAIDLSSSVETDGVKDLNKILEIVKVVRDYEG